MVRVPGCAQGVVRTIAGLDGERGSADGAGSAVRFANPTVLYGFGPWGVAVDDAGNIYAADPANHTIRKGFPALAISSSRFGLNNGPFGFTLTGPAGRLVIVEASIDLTTWLPIWTNTLATGLNFSDPQIQASSRRFYRAVLP